MKLYAALPAAALIALAACGGGDSGNSAEALENAAAQSDPAAAQVLENAAEEVREGNMTAEQAMQQAGNAQAATVSETPAPPSMQAQPNRGGQQTPPPKQHAGAADASGHEGNSH